MKKLLLTTLLAFISLTAPWRLMALGAETMVMRPGHVRSQAGQDKYWLAQDLEVRLNRMGWKVLYTPKLVENSNALGLTSYFERTIQIEESLSWNERYSVLAHEAGHTQQPFRLTPEQGEVFAESVSTLMAGSGIREHARYLASLKPNVLEVLFVLWPDIYKAAATLEE